MCPSVWFGRRGFHIRENTPFQSITFGLGNITASHCNPRGLGVEAVSISSPPSFKGFLWLIPRRASDHLETTLSHLFLPHLFYVRHNFLLVHTLFSHFFFLPLIVHLWHSIPTLSVPCTSSELSPWGPPPSRWAICSEAQVQSYQRGTGPCSQRHDVSLRGSWGAILCLSNTEVGLLTVVPTLPVGF